jgi:hypothetical protein
LLKNQQFGLRRPTTLDSGAMSGIICFPSYHPSVFHASHRGGKGRQA